MLLYFLDFVDAFVELDFLGFCLLLALDEVLLFLVDLGVELAILFLEFILILRKLYKTKINIRYLLLRRIHLPLLIRQLSPIQLLPKLLKLFLQSILVLKHVILFAE